MNVIVERTHIRTGADPEHTGRPLVVDLDGTLIRSDLLHETFLDAVSRHGHRILAGVRSDLSRQALKSHLADLSDIAYDALPYNEDVLRYIEAEKAKGRAIYLATASERRHADAIALYLGLFDGVFASDATVNLKGRHKAERLVSVFGEGGFDYLGNHASDLEIWRVAANAASVDLDRRSKDRLRQLKPESVELASRGFDWRDLLRAMRPHQYSKNALVFVPLLTSHQFNATAMLQAVLALVAFSICASAVYVLNDLLDLQADRKHPSKKRRPFASGRLAISTGFWLAPGLAAAAFGLALLVSPLFAGTLAVYFALTTAYSLSLKRKMIADVVVLAILYTIRVVAGAVAIGVHVSEWLLAFSLLIFTALALIKRYSELANRLDNGMDDPSNRDYRKSDLPVIMALAAAAGMNSITIMALYISAPEVRAAYNNALFLWALCPLFLYWIARILMLAHRRIVDEDPISFALKDRKSWLVGLASITIVLAAL